MEFLLFGAKLVLCLLTFVGSVVCARIGGNYASSAIGLLFDFDPMDRLALKRAATFFGGLLGACMVIGNLSREYVDLSGSFGTMRMALVFSFTAPLVIAAAVCSISLACRLADALISLPSQLASWADLLLLNRIARFMHRDAHSKKPLESSSWHCNEQSPVARLLSERNREF